MQLLADANARALAAGLPVWEFALELSHLLADGLTPTDVRWLCLRGWVLHARETTTPASPRRTFEPVANLTLDRRDCFVIASPERNPGAPGDVPRAGIERAQTVPTWDQSRGELRWGDAVVKRFHRPAPNQTTILAAFHEDGWPPMIDDPLPGSHSVDARQRLHDTVKCLNRNMIVRALSFAKKNNGQSVLWHPIRP